MVAVLFLVFVVAPIVELYGIIQVAEVIGGWNAIGLLVLCSLAGAWVVKRQGLHVLRRMQATVGAGRLPQNELTDGFLILLAGALLIPPGFISDVVAIALLLPPVRFLARTLVLRSVRRRSWVVHVAGADLPGAGRFGGTGVFDVTARDHPVPGDGGPAPGPGELER